MNTNTPKTPGEILADTIEEWMKGPLGLSRLREILADYRKPWTLGREVNGFKLGPGQEWHRQDWTRDMLPEGFRPLIDGEMRRERDMVTHDRIASGLSWVTCECAADMYPSGYFYRTRRPLPAVKKEPCYAVFTGNGGYPLENAQARAAFVVGNRYVIAGGSIGQSSTRLKIEGVEGIWNSAMFDYDEKTAPIENPYGALKPDSVLTPEQIAAGWVEWHGGPCPVFGGSKPRVIMRNGYISGGNTLASEIEWDHSDDPGDIVAYLPDPLEHVKKAHSEGKAIQWRFRGNPAWDDCHEGNPPEWSHLCEYRVKPAPVMVPLGPDDVPPGSVTRRIGDVGWTLVVGVGTNGITVAVDHLETFEELRNEGRLISRDGGKTWEKCEKPEGIK